jgi:hypothetical protein
MEWEEFAARLRDAGWPEEEIEAEINRIQSGYYDAE